MKGLIFYSRYILTLRLPVSLGRSSALHAPLTVVLITQLPPSHCGKEVTVPVEGVWVDGWEGGRRELIIISVCMQYPVPMVTRPFSEAKKRYNHTEHMISVRNASDLRSTPSLPGLSKQLLFTSTC